MTLLDTIHSEIRLSDAEVRATEKFARQLVQRSKDEYPEESYDGIERSYPEVARTRRVIVVTKFGPIRDNQLIIRTSLYCPDPSGADPFDPIGEIARWYPDAADGNYTWKMHRAHERKLVEFRRYLKTEVSV